MKSSTSKICTRALRNFNSSWSFFKCKKTTSRMSNGTWRKNISMPRKKLRGFNLFPWWSVNSWKLSTPTQELLDLPRDPITTFESCPLWIANYWSHRHQLRYTNIRMLLSMCFHLRPILRFPCSRYDDTKNRLKTHTNILNIFRLMRSPM